ncbi:hypothetical protein DL93DRAFT_2227184 [Clavulina sp. PMI_390]|nr:hypothetical protein DL93DRAFT_2227184 [Clavulina sp. PMI_390]
MDEDNMSNLATALSPTPQPATRYANVSIYNLPDELLILIFLRNLFGRTDPAAYVAKIVSVCRFWRSIAFACPRLWTNIAYSESREPVSKCDFEVVRNQMLSYLHRSGTASLSITLQFSQRPCRVAEIKTLLTPYFHRAESLSITFNTNPAAVRSLLPLPSRFEQLEALSFVVSSPPALIQGPIKIGNLLEHPESTVKLRSLRISPGHYLPYELDVSALNHATIMCNDNTVPAMRRLLADAKLLTNLEITELFSSQKIEGWDITIPSLVSLALPRADVACAFTAPNLKHISLNRVGVRWISLPGTPIPQYPSLESIECDCCDMTSEWMLDFLRAHPAVKKLSLRTTARASDMVFLRLILPHLLERFVSDPVHLAWGREMFMTMRPSAMQLADAIKDPLLPALETFHIVLIYHGACIIPGSRYAPELSLLSGTGHTGRPQLQVLADWDRRLDAGVLAYPHGVSPR